MLCHVFFIIIKHFFKLMQFIILTNQNRKNTHTSYHVISPNVINSQMTGAGAVLDNITFRNISVHSAEKDVYAYRMHYAADGGSISDITIENMDFCGKILTADDKNNGKIVKNEGGEFFDALTIQ